MQKHIAKRTKQTGLDNPMNHQFGWMGKDLAGFSSSQEAYDSMHIGDAAQARKLQAKTARK